MRILPSGLVSLALLLGACGSDKTTGTDTTSGNGGNGGTDTENQRPVADAGSDVTQSSLDAVTLDGRGSADPDGDPITFSWTFDRVPDGSTLATAEKPFSENNTTVNTTVFRPDQEGTYIVTLVVKDDKGLVSNPDYVVITISGAAQPIANAGDDQEATIDTPVSLDGSGSYDVDGKTLTYAWSLLTSPTGSTAALSPTDAVTTSFTPSVGGLYIASLVVNNGVVDSEPDTAVIRVSSADSSPPTALAGDDITTMDCMATALDGSASYDPNPEDSLTYYWSIQRKPTGSAATDATSFSDQSSATPTFYPDIAGTYQISLSVYDGHAWSTPDVLSLVATERTFNSEPSVDAGAATGFDGGSADCVVSGYTYDCESCAAMTVTLGGDAIVSDGDADPYTVAWSVVSGSAAITDSTSLTTTVKLSDAAPTEPGACEETEYVLSLAATDCPGESSSDTVTYTVTCCGLAVDTATDTATTSSFTARKKKK